MKMLIQKVNIYNLFSQAEINVKNCTNFHTKFDLILISPNPPLLITIFISQQAEVDLLPIYNFLNIFFQRE